MLRCSVLTFALIVAAPLGLFGQIRRPSASNNVTLTLAESSATASGIRPGGRALFFASGIQHNGYDRALVRIAQIAPNADEKGTATLTLDSPIAPGTIWAVVDLTDGRYAIASPAGYESRIVPLPANAFRRVTGRNGVVRFGFDHPTLDLLYVHPGLGAWVWYAMDGRTLDRDGPNGITLVDAADGKGIGETTGDAKELAPGGTLIAIDWYKMEYSAVRLDGTILGGAQ